MKKLIALILSLCMLLSVVGITAAADAGFTLTLEGEGAPAPLTGAVTYTLPTPVAPEGKVFAGWQGMHNEQNVFLPAGAEVTLTADATLTAVYVGMRMRSLPEIRYGIKGLRFLTDVSKADLNALQFLTTVGFGTLIAPQDHLKAGQFLTHATLNAAEKDFLDVETAGAYAETDETFTLAGSIGNVFEKNYCRLFLGAGYLSLTYSDGSTGYIYAPVKKATQVTLDGTYYGRALAAFGDRAQAQSDTHANETEHGFSPYNNAQLAFLKRVLDTTANLTLQVSGKKYTVSIGPALDCYTAPFTATFNSTLERYELTAIGDYRFDTDFQSVILDGLVYVDGIEGDDNISILQEGKKLYITGTFIYSGFY